MSDQIKDRAKSKSDKKINNAGDNNAGDNGAPAETIPTSSGGLIWLVVFVAIVGVGGWAFWPEIGPSIKPIIAKVRGVSSPDDFTLPVAEVAPAPTTTPTVETTLATPTAPIISTPPPDLAPNIAPSLVDALADIRNKLVAIEQRLSQLESRPQLTRDPTSSAQVLVLATTQLASRLGGEGSFAAELDVLEKVAGESTEIMDAVAALRPHAEAGIPAITTLHARFGDIARATTQARLGADENGWMGKIKNKLGSLVTVRRTDPATTTDPVERALALAEAALEVGALDEAVSAVGSIEGNAGAVAAPWLGDASARLLAQDTLETLHNYALSRLGGPN